MRDADECPCSRELWLRKPGGHGALLAGLSCLAWAQDRGCMQGQGCPHTLPQPSSAAQGAQHLSSLQSAPELTESAAAAAFPSPSIDSGAMLS